MSLEASTSLERTITYNNLPAYKSIVYLLKQYARTQAWLFMVTLIQPKSWSWSENQINVKHNSNISALESFY